MGPPPIQLFLTTIASQPALRQRQEYILRTLQVKKLPFLSYDLASDEDAKRLWKRKAPLDKQQLPGILVGGRFPGTFQQFEEAVEFGELEIFLRQNEEWKPMGDEKPLLEVKPIGVPGVYEPLQMFPKHAPSRSPSPSPVKLREKEKKEVNMTGTLGDLGLEGVSVSENDLRALVEELGLGEDDAKDLAKGLASGSLPSSAKKEAVKGKEPRQQLAEELKSAVKQKPTDIKKDQVRQSVTSGKAVGESGNNGKGKDKEIAVVKTLTKEGVHSNKKGDQEVVVEKKTVEQKAAHEEEAKQEAADKRRDLGHAAGETKVNVAPVTADKTPKDPDPIPLVRVEEAQDPVGREVVGQKPVGEEVKQSPTEEKAAKQEPEEKKKPKQGAATIKVDLKLDIVNKTAISPIEKTASPKRTPSSDKDWLSHPPAGYKDGFRQFPGATSTRVVGGRRATTVERRVNSVPFPTAAAQGAEEAEVYREPPRQRVRTTSTSANRSRSRSRQVTLQRVTVNSPVSTA